jgi:HEAT repeat protein
LLEDFLERPSHAGVIRGGAFDGLAELGDAESLPLLREGLRYGAPAHSRAAAIRAAAALGRRHLHLHPTVLDMICAVAEHREQPAAAFRGKLAALRALERLGDQEALPLLRRIADQEVDGRLVRLARLSADQLRRGASKPAELHGLREDLTLAFKENKALRERVEVLEQNGKQPGGKPGSRRPSAQRKRKGSGRGRTRA